MRTPSLCESPAWERAGIGQRFKKLRKRTSPAGGGAYGEVVKAWDSARDCYVAVKMSHKEDEESLESLAHEYSVLQALDHPNIQRALAYGRRDEGDEERDRAYLVTEWINGRTLGAGGLGPSPRAVALGVMQGLAFAHAQGVRHLDLSASNVMREDTRGVLIDFGCAAMSSGPASELPCPSLDMTRALRILAERAHEPELRRATERFKMSAIAHAWCGGRFPSAAELSEDALFPVSPRSSSAGSTRSARSDNRGSPANGAAPSPKPEGPRKRWFCFRVTPRQLSRE